MSWKCREKELEKCGEGVTDHKARINRREAEEPFQVTGDQRCPTCVSISQESANIHEDTNFLLVMQRKGSTYSIWLLNLKAC